MPNEMIDNAAYALVSARFKLAGCEMPISKEVWLSSPSQVEDRRGFREMARAVIASMKELSDDVAMVGVMHDYSLEAAWRAMIDAILTEEGETR
jgi:hypothetical protein